MIEIDLQVSTSLAVSNLMVRAVRDICRHCLYMWK